MPQYKLYYAYILASDSGTFYIGFTGFLEQRVFQHKEKLIEGFTKKYGIHRLLHFESFDDVHRAMARETQLKGWTRAKKIALIEKTNPRWKDLSADWYRDINECSLDSSNLAPKGILRLRARRGEPSAQNDNLLDRRQQIRPRRSRVMIIIHVRLAIVS
jgi:putative endonuclease